MSCYEHVQHAEGYNNCVSDFWYSSLVIISVSKVDVLKFIVNLFNAAKTRALFCLCTLKYEMTHKHNHSEHAFYSFFIKSVKRIACLNNEIIPSFYMSEFSFRVNNNYYIYLSIIFHHQCVLFQPILRRYNANRHCSVCVF